MCKYSEFKNGDTFELTFDSICETCNTKFTIKDIVKYLGHITDGKTYDYFVFLNNHYCKFCDTKIKLIREECAGTGIWPFKTVEKEKSW